MAVINTFKPAIFKITATTFPNNGGEIRELAAQTQGYWERTVLHVIVKKANGTDLAINSGVEIYLVDANASPTDGDLIATTFTDGAGVARFTALPPADGKEFVVRAVDAIN